MLIVACAGGDESEAGSAVPMFEGSVPAPAGAADVGAVDDGAPSGVAPSASTPSSSSEGNAPPARLDPSGTGGASSASSSGTNTGVGGSSATSAGGSAMVSTGGSSMSAAGAPSSAGTPIDTGGVGAAGAGGSGVTPPPSDPTPAPTEPEPEQPETSCPPNALFCDDFEDDANGQFPGAPWQDNTGSGASVRVDGVQAFSGRQAVHVNAPPNAGYRRGYFSLEQGSSNVFPALSRGMFGRAMMFLDATPNAVVHWTIIQAEGRAAAGTHDAYYRYGGQQQGGAGIMANYETNSGVSTDCYSHSATRMPVQRWACVEWHFDTARSEMQLWLDGQELTDMHVVGRPTTPGSGCLGNATNGQWLAPPAFTTLHLGWENYQTSSNDRNLWIDDVALGSERMGCPAP